MALFFVFFSNSLANTCTLDSVVVTLDLLDIYGPVQDKGFKTSCSVDARSSHSTSRACL